MSELIEEYAGVFMACLFISFLPSIFFQILQIVTGG